MKLFTIGFTKKTAEKFFSLLRENEVKLLIDIRLRPEGQLAGFAKQVDLPFFLENLADCGYLHYPELAPTDVILDQYREDKDWSKYERDYRDLMTRRQILEHFDFGLISRGTSCFLCSEETAEKCHRRLAAEVLQSKWREIEIVHL